MPRTNCQHCQKLFTFRTGATTAKLVCPFCRKSMTPPAPAASPWFLAQKGERHGPYSWDQVTALAAGGQIGVDDMLWQEGQLQWNLASTFLDLSAAPPVEEPPAQAPTPAADMTSIQARLRELSDQFERNSRNATLAETPIEIVAVDLSDEGPPVIENAVPEPTPAEPAVPAELVVQTTAVENLSGSWEFAKWLSVTATSLVAVCALVFWFKNGIDQRDLSAPPKSERHAEQQEAYENHKPNRNAPDALTIAAWSGQFIEELNRCRKGAGLKEVTVDIELSQECGEHAKYLARNIAPNEATPAKVYRQNPSLPSASMAGDKTAGVALVCYAEPMPALERWMGRLFSRVQLLDASLERLGVGFEQNAQGAWVCVANPVHGRVGEPAADRVVLYPAPNQKDVPCVGYDAVDDAKDKIGFPISATFPRQAVVRNVQATLTDDAGKSVDLRVSSPDLPLNAKLQAKSVGLHPATPLEGGRCYTVVLIAMINGAEWRQSWQFTTVRLGTVTE